MRLTREDLGKVVLLTLEGKLTVDHGAESLAQEVRTLAGQGRTAVVLDLGRVELMDSLGIEAIVSAHVSLSRRGGKLTVAGPSDRVRRLFDITRLSGVLEICRTRGEALAEFDLGID